MTVRRPYDRRSSEMVRMLLAQLGGAIRRR